MNIININLSLIDEDTDQPRYQFGEESLQELMRSIEEIGLLSPIKVRPTDDGRYKIIYGNRRYKASKLLGQETISCIVSAITDEVDIYLEQIAENLTREGFSPIEEAEAFDKMLNHPRFSSSIKFLSSKLSKPESYIKNKIELLKFGQAVKKLIVSGTDIRKDLLTEEQLLPIKDLLPEHRDPLALIIARDEMPVSDVKKIAQLFKDKAISSSAKDKLLYKNGPQLLETWSVFRHNKAEREKAAKLKAEQEQLKAEQEQRVTEHDQVNEEPSGPPHALEQAGEDQQISVLPDVAGQHQDQREALHAAIEQLAATLPERLPAPPTTDAAQHTSLGEQRSLLLNSINQITTLLEQRLADWQALQQEILSTEEPHSD